MNSVRPPPPFVNFIHKNPFFFNWWLPLAILLAALHCGPFWVIWVFWAIWASLAILDHLGLSGPFRSFIHDGQCKRCTCDKYIKKQVSATRNKNVRPLLTWNIPFKCTFQTLKSTFGHFEFYSKLLQYIINSTWYWFLDLPDLFRV